VFSLVSNYEVAILYGISCGLEIIYFQLLMGGLSQEMVQYHVLCNWQVHLRMN